MVDFSKKFPDRYFDVAIAEQHAVLLAGGLAVGGMHPVVCVYSTFLQRAYDQLIHDLAIQDAPAVVAIDRAGVVGPDGPTHQGVFDIAFIRAIPNMILMTPSTLGEQWIMLNTALSYGHPAAVRYPRGAGIYADLNEHSDETVEIGKGRVLREGADICFLVWGPLVHSLLTAIEERMAASADCNYTVVDMRFAKPVDEELVIEMAGKHRVLVTLEDGVICGGVGEEILRILNGHFMSVPVLNIGIPDEFVEQATANEIYEQYGMDGKSVISRAREFMDNWQKFSSAG